MFPGDNACYVPTGYIVYALANNLLAVPFHPNTFRTTGEAVSMIEGVFRIMALYSPNYAVSDSGTLVYIPQEVNGTTKCNLVWVDREGKEEVLNAEPSVYSAPRISPDGKRIALSIATAKNANIWIWDLVRKTPTRLTFDVTLDSSPIWTRDGKRILFASQRGGWVDVYWTSADGTGGVKHLGGAPAMHSWPSAWSSDEKNLILTQATGGNYDIGVVSMGGEPKWRPLLNRNFNETQPQISPDGKWMAYTSNESSRNEVYVLPFPPAESGNRLQVSIDGGDSPLWSRDGLELFYRNGDAVMAVPVKEGSAFSLGSPKLLFREQYVSSVPDAVNWDVSPDSKRFLMIREVGGGQSMGANPRKINIAVNWLEELKQRVPVK